MQPLIDTHTHLTDKNLKKQLPALLERSRAAGVESWITVGTSVADSAAALKLCREHPGLAATVGVHPHEAGAVVSEYREQLRDLAGAKPVVAIGEIGLDYHYDFSVRPSQKRVFEQQLELAGEISLPVVIHCREAFDDCLAILRQWDRDDVPVVFHCFSGDVHQAATVIDAGYFVSFTGTITFRNAADAQQVAQYVPLDRIMLETDCPWLSPEPKRNVKPNEPALLVHTAAKLAQLRGLTADQIAQATATNSRLFYKL
jgi:TatD DNase family protein